LRASELSPLKDRFSLFQAAEVRYRYRSIWVMNIAAIPLRQWLIAASGLISGGLTALLLH